MNTTPKCPYCGVEMLSQGEIRTSYDRSTQEWLPFTRSWFECPFCLSRSPRTVDTSGEKSSVLALSAALRRYEEPSAKTNRTCATCANCKPSDNTNRLFCIYHGEYDHEHETYADDYCSNWEHRPTDEERQSVAWEGSE